MRYFGLKSASDRSPEGRPARRHRLLLAAYLLAVLAMTLAPLPPDVAGHLALRGADKLVHALLIGGLSVLLQARPVDPPTLPAAAVAVALSALVAGAIELAQEPIPYRSGEVADFLVGTAGALVASLAYWLWQRRRARRVGRGPG